MNEKQQQLTFEKGITNVPSDLLCSDNALEESVGMIHDDGEHRVIQKPTEYITFPRPKDIVIIDDVETEVVWPETTAIWSLYIHKFNNSSRYIISCCKNPNDPSEPWYLKWAIRDEETGTVTINDMYRHGEVELMEYPNHDLKVTSVGKTLVVSAVDGLQYFLWKEDEYKNLGQIPKQDVRFYLNDDTSQMYGRFLVNTLSIEHIEWEDNGGSNYYTVAAKSREEWNNVIIGLYSKNKNAVANKKGFCLPFLVRTALRLYDDSYIYVSQPVMLFPSIAENSLAQSIQIGGNITMMTFYKKLLYENRCYDFTNPHDPIPFYDDWTDIVKDIVVFISAGIEIHDLSVDQIFSGLAIDEPIPASQTIDGIFDKGSDMQYYSTQVPHFKVLTPSPDVATSMTSASIFYKLCTIGLFEHDFSHHTPIDDKIEKHHLENLTTQEQLEYDDYFSRSIMVPKTIYSYNSRLNLANVSRSMFDGYDYFLPYLNPHSSSAYYLSRFIKIYVTIQTDDGERVVLHEGESLYIQNLYFFYPDSRAKHVSIFRYSNLDETYHCILNEDLKEHEGLNGAYYFKGMPGSGEEEHASYIDEPQVKDKPEILGNYIITSEVNNPWVFKAEGYNKVGTGKIIGMSTITQALSQGQFGQYPLLVFSESGIWAMSVNNTGLFQAIHPMSREVCNNPDSITQTDGAVFFSSEKGLMVVVGSDVKCVSEQLSGLESDFEGEVKMGNFRDYMKDCFIAYDYRDSLLWIFNNSRQQNQGYCYVYAIKGGTFGKYRFAQPIENVVNNYPDYLLQSGSTLFSLTGRQNINLDTSTYSGLIITRPMKLENGLALKSLMQVRHILQMKGRMTLRIYVSNNLNHWAEVHSLRGTPWKYYRFRFDFSDMKATDRFAGSMVITQERRTDKLL